MKKIATIFSCILLNGILFSQPVLNRDSIRTGLKFDLYSLSNVNTANLRWSGANVIWDLSTATATLAGTAEFQEMSATPYATLYPTANFAIKFTINSAVQYSLFKMSTIAMEEVGNNVSTAGGVPFTDSRTALVFPFSYTQSVSDNYQKMGQGTKTIKLAYDAYGSFIAPSITTSNVMRIFTVDNGDTSANFWSASPCVPVFTANVNNSSFIYWKLQVPAGIRDINNNLLMDIYPNPVGNILSIHYAGKIDKVEILELTGVVHLAELNGNNIDLSTLPSGIYCIRVYTEYGVIVKKFIRS